MKSLRSRRTMAAALVVAVIVGAIAVLSSAAGSGDALVVYNGRSHYGGEAAFKAFEKETGIDVELFGGDATQLYERLRNEGADTEADVLVTVDGANLWLAEEAGLLAPVQSAVLEERVPADLRDPDGSWFGLSRRVRTVMRSTERVQEGDVDGYSDLGDPRFRGKVCLRTSNSIYNQTLVADLLTKRGPESAERLLRSWIDNDPQVLGNDIEVLKAIAAGRCDLGLTNHYYLARLIKEDPDFAVAPVWVEQDGAGVHSNLSGAAVVKGSDRPAQALRLIEFLTTHASQEAIGEQGEFPANPDVPPAEHIREWTGFKTDSLDVARSGANQDDAVALMAKVGWD